MSHGFRGARWLLCSAVACLPDARPIPEDGGSVGVTDVANNSLGSPAETAATPSDPMRTGDGGLGDEPDAGGACAERGGCSSNSGCALATCSSPPCETIVYAASLADATLSRIGRQDFVEAASATLQSIVYSQAPDVQGSCGVGTVRLVDRSPTRSVVLDITPFLLAQGMTTAAGAYALSGDGLTLVGLAADGQRFLSTRRPALYEAAFAQPSEDIFAAINAAIAGTSGVLRAPVLSKDGLEFYYTVGNLDEAGTGIHRAVRASVDVDFGPGSRVVSIPPEFEYVTDLSGDRRTLIAFQAFAGWVFTREDVDSEFSNPNFPYRPPQLVAATGSSGISLWNQKLSSDCRSVVATGSVGGCSNEDIYFLNRPAGAR